MANTYTLIEAQTLGSSAASVTFSAIPATYTDLLVKTSIRTSEPTYGYDNVYISFNGVPSGTAYSGKVLADYVTGVLSQSQTATSSFNYLYTESGAATANTFNNGEMYIPNAFSANYKSISADSVTESNSASAYTSTRGIGAGLWSSTSAITSIVFTSATGSFVQYSSFYLYGISNS